MEFKQIVAIVRNAVLEKVEQRLKEIGIKGITVSPVKGYGEYANFYKGDWMVNRSKIEIFTEQKRVDEIARAVLETAHVGAAGDGILAVMPVEKLYRIRTMDEIGAQDD